MRLCIAKSHYFSNFDFMCFKHVITFSIFFLVLLSSALLQAQDVHFSQFYMSPLTINPAQTGNMDGQWRFSGNHRNQWRTIGKPFNTTAIGYDRNFFYYNEQFSGGLVYLFDETGGSNLKMHKIALSGAYHKTYDIHEFHFGFQPTYVHKSYDLSGTSFPSQYDRNTGQFNANLPNGDPFLNDQINYFDFNAGVAYGIDLDKFRPEIGIALFHINKPNESFFGTDYQVPIRTTFTFRAEVGILSNVLLLPNIMYMAHGKASELLYGTNVLFHLKENQMEATGVYGGVLLRDGFNRNTDAAVVIVGMRFPNLEIGFNYDLNISELKASTDLRGAFELSVIYTSPSMLLKKTAIPCDRY